MRAHLRFCAVLLIALIMCSCSSHTTVVLLSDPDGRVGSVNVGNDKGNVNLNTANQATSVRSRQASPEKPNVISAKKIDALFSDVLAIQVPPPRHFLLYFEEDSTALDPESLRLLPDILATIKKRNSVDISIVGHSDTAGDREYNLRLSTRRAESVSSLLVEKGVARSNIVTTSHGEENPLVQTGDNVSEPKNRRVEVIVR